MIHIARVEYTPRAKQQRSVCGAGKVKDTVKLTSSQSILTVYISLPSFLIPWLSLFIHIPIYQPSISPTLQALSLAFLACTLPRDASVLTPYSRVISCVKVLEDRACETVCTSFVVGVFRQHNTPHANAALLRPTSCVDRPRPALLQFK